MERRGRVRTESEAHWPQKTCEGLKAWPQGGAGDLRGGADLGTGVEGLTRQEHCRHGLELDRKLAPSL